MMTRILSLCENLGHRAKQHLGQWTKPATATLVTGALSDTARGRTDLIAENLMLRQQLIVLNRQMKRPQLTNGDRLRLVLLALSWPNVPIRQAARAMMVSHATVSGSRDVNRPIRGERRSIHSPMAQPSAAAGMGFSVSRLTACRESVLAERLSRLWWQQFERGTANPLAEAAE